MRAYIELVGRVLGEAAEMRNDMLHARPATIGEDQRLYRWKPTDWRGAGRAFVIDTAWLNSTIDKLSAASVALGNIRPTHKNAAFAKGTPALVGLAPQRGQVLVRCPPDRRIKCCRADGGQVIGNRHPHVRHAHLQSLVALVVVTTTASLSTSGSTVRRPLSIRPMSMMWV